CSPSILSVDPAVGNPIGHVVECGFVERNTIAEFAFVRLDLVSWTPEIELQGFVDELTAATGRIAWMVSCRVIGPNIGVGESADRDGKEIDPRINIGPRRDSPYA